MMRLGDAIDAWDSADDSRRYSDAVDELKVALVRAEPIDAGELTRRQFATLLRALNDAHRSHWPCHRDVDLVIAIVRAMASIGNPKAETLIEALSEECSQPEIRSAAKEILPLLRARLASHTDRSRLLRAGSILVRPSNGVQPVPQNLLRSEIE